VVLPTLSILLGLDLPELRTDIEKILPLATTLVPLSTLHLVVLLDVLNIEKCPRLQPSLEAFVEATLLRATPSVEDDDDNWYPTGRPVSPFGPTRYQDSRISNEDTYHHSEPAAQLETRSSRQFSSYPEPGNGSTSTSITTRRPVTSGTPSLPSFRIRKRSQQQHSASFKQVDRTLQPFKPTQEQVELNPSTSNGSDAD